MFKWSFRKVFGLQYGPKPGEILPGVVRPSYALAGLVAGKILADVDSVKSHTKNWWTNPKMQEENPGDYYSLLTWTSKDNRLTVTLAEPHLNYRAHSLEWQVRFDEELYSSFEEEDLALIREAFDKMLSLRDEARKNKKKAEAQQKACDLIQSMFTTPETNCDCNGCKIYNKCEKFL